MPANREDAKERLPILSVEPKAVAVNKILVDRCPACKRRLSEHTPSERHPRSAEAGKVAVANGRCRPGGEPAPQKLSWVTLREELTEAEYRERYTDRAPPLEPCPGCGGKLHGHGRYGRGFGEEGGVRVNPLPLYRGLCPQPACPVVTVTHYPCFVTPYEIAPTSQREAVVRERAERRRSWASLSAQAGYAPQTVRRWVRRVQARAAEILVGLSAALLWLDPGAALERTEGATRGGARGDLLPAMFRVADTVVEVLTEAGAWREGTPRLGLPRLLRPPGPSPLPVWA